MTKLDIKHVGFTTGVRLADGLVKQAPIMAMTYKDGSPVLLHALKGLAMRLRGIEEYGVVSINGVGYATKGE